MSSITSRDCDSNCQVVWKYYHQQQMNVAIGGADEGEDGRIGSGARKLLAGTAG
jgi:hypothetical protein